MFGGCARISTRMSGARTQTPSPGVCDLQHVQGCDRRLAPNVQLLTIKNYLDTNHGLTITRQKLIYTTIKLQCNNTGFQQHCPQVSDTDTDTDLCELALTFQQSSVILHKC